MEETKKEEALKEEKKEKSGCSWKNETNWPPMIRFIMNGGKFM